MLTGLISIYEGHVHLLKKKKKRKKEIEIIQLRKGTISTSDFISHEGYSGNGEGYGKDILLLFFQI